MLTRLVHEMCCAVNEVEDFKIVNSLRPSASTFVVSAEAWAQLKWTQTAFQGYQIMATRTTIMKNSTKCPVFSQFPKIAAVCLSLYTLVDRWVYKRLHFGGKQKHTNKQKPNNSKLMQQTLHSADQKEIQSNWIKMWPWIKKELVSACRQVWRSCPEGVLGLHTEDSWW